ncbi:MAG: hypothetical protein H0T84_08455 [Tatlockia sp.]|nr:hypothetical protein [Tatlockia sp.]
MNHDNENEAIGIIGIIVIIILAAIGLYYFFSHRPPTALNIEETPTFPLEVPHPTHHKDLDQQSLNIRQGQISDKA